MRAIELRRMHILEAKQAKRDKLYNYLKEYDLLDKTTFTHNGSIALIDDRFYYYTSIGHVRVKGQTTRYKIKNFKHFHKVFIRGVPTTRRVKKNG